MDIKDIKDLIITINNTDIETVEIEQNDIKIMISKGNSIKENKEVKNLSAGESVKEERKEEVIEETIIEEDNLFIVKSPVVGVFYQSPNPDAEPFVQLGDRVEEGSVLCIIEAMKVMNEIESEVSGEIVEILVNNEDIVEYGEAIMKIRR